MLFRHIGNFSPSTIVPALTSFAAVYIFTRMLSPSEYGKYSLVTTLALFAQYAFFYWLPVSASRFIPLAKQQGKLRQLSSTLYTGFAGCAAIFLVISGISIYLAPVAVETRGLLWLGMLFCCMKSLIMLNLAFHRDAMHARRYNFIECGQALIALGLGVVFINISDLNAGGILLGLLGAAFLVLLVDMRFIATLIKRSINRDQFTTMLAYGLPVSAGFILNGLLALSDRLLIEFYLGSAELGMYSVASTVMDRTLMISFIFVSMVAFPMAVRQLEERGPDAAKSQMYRNGTALLALTVPVCAGLILVTPQLVTVMLGPQYRDQAVEIMPWIAIATVLAGLQVHYFDHAFHLGRRTHWLLLSLGPSILLKVGLNIILLPRIGLMGAAYATVAGYLMSLCGSVYFGRRAFSFPFPFSQAFRVVAATLPMIIILRLLDFDSTMAGLATMVFMGAVIYAGCAFIVDVAGIRTFLFNQQQTVSGGMQ